MQFKSTFPMVTKTMSMRMEMSLCAEWKAR